MEQLYIWNATFAFLDKVLAEKNVFVLQKNPWCICREDRNCSSCRREKHAALHGGVIGLLAGVDLRKLLYEDMCTILAAGKV